MRRNCMEKIEKTRRRRRNERKEVRGSRKGERNWHSTLSNEHPLALCNRYRSSMINPSSGMNLHAR
ncbi:hypothetical protein V1477_016240 [Vespula maculifrons]|uniref:Uncharacterized protein n=1 Tax=Vespula maculifrons TaxID=7453 RepID=A0ABD2BCG5_VESMC